MLKQRPLALVIGVLAAIVLMVNSFYLDSVSNWIVHVTTLLVGSISLAYWGVGARNRRSQR